MKITSITPDSIILSTQVSEVFRQMRRLDRKDNPHRRGDLYGPYEAVWLERTGQLPPEYFEEGDLEPWKLLPDEAKRNILWQVLSGCLDINADWSLVYIQLVMDEALSDDDFAKELAKVNRQFLHRLDHRHKSNAHLNMRGKINHIDCPGCSATAAILLVDPVIRKRFQTEIATLSKLEPQARMELLKNEGLDKYLNTTIQDEKDGVIILPK